ncbi:hypothetical protein INT46_004333 [Mucor plumbeus]|uniref:BED-type domain-containing protein n=1 Tax=Mucor plumbeus TaxID=97098 RepID=A0A8H7QZJ4_9FUNG|nr:hypothetical protein INT46_004333 [Mucor plumbeus]
MPRPLSDSWQYFELLSSDNGKSKKARCSFCNHIQSASITRLHQHLLYRCSRISSKTRDQLRQKQDDRGNDSPAQNRNELLQPQSSSNVNYHFNSALENTLDPSSSASLNPHSNYFDAALSPTGSTNFSTVNHIAFTSSNDNMNQHNQQQHRHHHHTNQQQQNQHQQPDRSQAMLDWHLARALFSANISFDKIENPHIVEFFKCLQPNYIVPKAGRLQQFLLKEQHWDLIQWSESNMTTQQIPSPPTPTTSHQRSILQQRSENVGHIGLSTSNNNVSSNNNSNAIGNRLLSSIHPPAELEGGL